MLSPVSQPSSVAKKARLAVIRTPQESKLKMPQSVSAALTHLVDNQKRNTFDIHIPESLLHNHERVQKSHLKKIGTGAGQQITSTLQMIRENQNFVSK